MTHEVPAGIGVRRPGVGALLLGAYALLLCTPGMPDAGWLDPVPLHATVVWTRADRVYLAAADSVALDAGTILSFEYRGKTAARGEVTAVSSGELIAARLTTGSLGKIKKLDRIRVTATRAYIPRASLLRIGYPSASRPSLLFACDSMSLRPAGPGNFYRTEERGPRSYRLVRNPDSTAAAPWPDTLLIRLFDEAADEEIALERGELDAAVFWPGEASTHIREAMHWRSEIKGARAQGVLAALAVWETTPVGWLDTPDLGPLESLNERLFRGDLMPSEPPARPGAGTPADSRRRVRFEVDRACPGHQVLEQYLNLGEGVPGTPPAAAIIRVVYLEAPVGRTDSPHPLWFSTIGCPILSRPNLDTYLKELGPDALVNLLDCVPTGRK